MDTIRRSNQLGKVSPLHLQEEQNLRYGALFENIERMMGFVILMMKILIRHPCTFMKMDQVTLDNGTGTQMSKMDMVLSITSVEPSIKATGKTMFTMAMVSSCTRMVTFMMVISDLVLPVVLVF